MRLDHNPPTSTARRGLTNCRGTPTSTTTSLSALSTVAIKDGHRGHPQEHSGDSHGNTHAPFKTNLEAERADRISRLAGLERVSTLRAPPQHTNSGGASGHVQGAGASGSVGGGGASSISPQTTPRSTAGAFPPNYPAQHHLTAAYFDSNGQPVAVTKQSTVGTASATEGSSHFGEGDSTTRTTGAERDEDMLSATDTYEYREGMGSVTTSMGGDPDPDAMDEDFDNMATRSVGGYEDRMSDDGSASLVGFGEGAGSTVSGPIYHRRPIPAGVMASANQQSWNLERTNSGLSEAARRERDRDVAMGGGADTPPISASAMQERRDARMMDGVSAEQHYHFNANSQPQGQAQGQQPNPYYQSHHLGTEQDQTPGEAADRIIQRLDHGESRAGRGNALSSPGREGAALGNFYFEGETREE